MENKKKKTTGDVIEREGTHTTMQKIPLETLDHSMNEEGDEIKGSTSMPETTEKETKTFSLSAIGDDTQMKGNTSDDSQTEKASFTEKRRAEDNDYGRHEAKGERTYYSKDD